MDIIKEGSGQKKMNDALKRHPVLFVLLLAFLMIAPYIFFGGSDGTPQAAPTISPEASNNDRALCETASTLASLIDQGYAQTNSEVLAGIQFLKDKSSGSSLEGTIRTLHEFSIAGNYDGAADAWAKLGRECEAIRQ